MKIITTNFVKCAAKPCASAADSFPLQFSDCEILQTTQEFDPIFVAHMLDRLNWNALIAVAKDLGNQNLPPNKPANLDPIMEDDQAVLRELHTLLIETQIVEGRMVCKSCNHTYFIKNYIPNFLLPPHLC